MTPCLTGKRVLELESELCESEERLRRKQGRRLEAERDVTQEQQQTARQVQTLRQEKEGLFVECVVYYYDAPPQNYRDLVHSCIICCNVIGQYKVLYRMPHATMQV